MKTKFYGTSRLQVKKALRRGGAAFALLLSGVSLPALAQDAGQSSPQDTASSTGIADIIVTASRRAENLQKESRAISVVGAEQLARQGVTGAEAVQDLVPGLTIARNGPQLQVSIRGVGDRTINASTDPAIAINVDGIYYPKSFEANASFFDLERVEVLKGPQGTLYGRNASSGAINLITAKPKFETSGFAEVEIGNYGNQRGTAAINTSFGDAVAVRLSGQIVDREGYLTDGLNDDKSKAVRLQVLIAPTDVTSLLLTGFYAHIGGKGSSGVIARRFGSTPSTSPVPDPSNPWAGPTDPRTQARINATNPGYQTIVENNSFQDIDIYSMSAQFQHNMDWGSLTVIPSYVGARLEGLNYAALVVPTYQKSTSDQLSIEARLSSREGSPIQWVVGGFASSEDVDDQYQSRIPYSPAPAFGSFALVSVSPHRDDRTWAVFGETNASVTDTLRLIAGARYTWEKKIVRGFTNPIFAPIPQFPIEETDAAFPARSSPGSISVDGQSVDKAFNFRLGAEYDVAPRSMLYATVSTGFKAGGFYANVAPDNAYAPEKLTSYQVGMKNRFFDNRLQLNVEGFYWDYKDKQESFLALLPIGNVLVTQNAGKVSMYGFDASAIVQISENDVLSGEVEYLHSKYDRYVYTYTGAPDTTVNCGTIVNGSETTRDCSGYPLVRAPKWSGRVGYERTQPLPGLGKLVFNAQMTFSSPYFVANNFSALTRTKAYQLYDASLTWASENDRFSVTGFIKNIGNTPVYQGGVVSASLQDALVGMIGAPRTYGVRFRAGF